MKKPLTYFVSMFAIVLMIGLTYCDGTESDIVPSQSLSKVGDTMPTVVGGVTAIAEHITYPEIAKRAGIQGKVFVNVVLDIDGTVLKTEVKKGIGAGCDEAAVNAIKACEFTPGYKDGEPLKTELTIPVAFKLSDDKSSEKPKVE